MKKVSKITVCLMVATIMGMLVTNAQWTLTGTGTTGTISTPGNVNAGGNVTAFGSQVYVRNDGEARFHLYNGGGQAEWLLGQKSLANSNFILSKKVATAEMDFLNIYPSGRMHIDGPELLYLLNRSGVIISKAWGGNGNLTVEGNQTTAGTLTVGGNLIIPTASTEYVKIGSVGTPNIAGYKLFVDQGILTEKVKVAVATSTQWADHVFYNGYGLMSLGEVEQFIKANHHLPNVPSAAEMVNEGNDLGKTDAKLLEKIEELTLYMIELKKENETLKKELAALKEDIQNLRR